MQNIIRIIRRKFHPLYYARKSGIGRLAIRLIDRPRWLKVKGVGFKVRGRLLTHGLAFAVTGSQEVNPEALVSVSMRELQLRSFWDVGANIGHYTWLMKTIRPSIEAVLFEPLPANAALIKETLRKNQFQQTTLIEAGVSSSPGEGILNSDTLAGATSTLENQEKTFEERHFGFIPREMKIALVTIDEIRKAHCPVDLMKIDVEGHEADVLRGGHATIQSDQPILMIECGHRDHACLNVLVSLGYTIVNADRIGERCDASTSNYFCIPQRFASQCSSLLEMAGREARHSDGG